MHSHTHVSRVVVAIGTLAVITAIGTAGFMWTEGLPLLDALYMAVITLSTVGYQEVAPASQGGRLFTIGFIVIGVGAALYTVATVAEFFIEGRLREALGRRAMERTIRALRNHVIVCGYGRLGRAVTDALLATSTRVVVVEQNPDLAPALDAAEVPYVIGSAVEEGILERAGIEHAQAVVTATPSDPDNVYIALAARELNPQIAIHARGETDQGMRRMRLAGAEQVISLHRLGGQRIANAIVRPAVVDFIELSAPGADAPIDLEEVVLEPGCHLADVVLRDLRQHGVKLQVVAIKRLGLRTLLNPGSEDVLRVGDHIVVVGDRENLRRLASLAESPEATPDRPGRGRDPKE